jgi:hypothetical protein
MLIKKVKILHIIAFSGKRRLGHLSFYLELLKTDNGINKLYT